MQEHVRNLLFCFWQIGSSKWCYIIFLFFRLSLSWFLTVKQALTFCHQLMISRHCWMIRLSKHKPWEAPHSSSHSRQKSSNYSLHCITITLKCETTISQLFKIFILQFFFYLSLVSITTVVFCNLPSFSILVSISLSSVQALYYNIKSFVVKIDWE